MQNDLRVIELAKECALFQFSVLARRMVEEGIEGVRQAMRRDPETIGGPMRKALQMLLAEGPDLEERLYSLYAGYLDRAMRTMYTDLRQGLHNVSAASLSLIDDQVMDRQMEVDRLVQVLRDVDRESLGRISLMISRLHNQREVRERENPFRPYLLARALHEAVRGKAADDAVAAILLEYLLAPMAEQLPHFLGAIREVFESNGVQVRFQPQAGSPAPAAPAAQRGLAAPGLDDLLARLFPRGGGVERPPPAAVLNQLSVWQQRAAAGLALDPEQSLQAGRNPLLALRDRMALPDADRTTRSTMQMVAMLYELLLADTEIPPAVREQVARLQVPVVRAALLEPGLLRDHPARRLVNRLCSAGVGVPQPAVMQEIARIVDRILCGFEEDLTVFSDCIDAFDRFLADWLRQASADAARLIDAVERARAGVAMARLLASLETDPRIVRFILESWLPLMPGAGGEASESGGSWRSVLAELAWSVQPWRTPEERDERVKRLPSLLARLKSGLQRSGMPDEACGSALDEVVAVLFGVLRGAPAAPGKLYSGLEAMHRLFSRFPRFAGSAPQGAVLDAAAIAERLRSQGIQVAAVAPGGNAGAGGTEAAIVLARLEPGMPLRSRNDGEPGCIIWICPARSVFVLRSGTDAPPVVYLAGALEKALREGMLRPAEKAPAFDRALESLLFGAASLKGNIGAPAPGAIPATL